MKKILNSAVFFLIGAVTIGSCSVKAADPHDIIGGLVGLKILHDLAHKEAPEKEVVIIEKNPYQDRYDRIYETYRYIPRRQGDIGQAYRRHFPCGRQYTGLRGCRRILRDPSATDIIILLDR